jgi:hypothetical protein
MSDTTPGASTELTTKLANGQFWNLVASIRAQEVATLAAALLGNRRKSISLAELLEVTRDIQFAKYPAPNNPEYQEWEKTKSERLSRIYK